MADQLVRIELAHELAQIERRFGSRCFRSFAMSFLRFGAKELIRAVVARCRRRVWIPRRYI